MIQNSTIFCSQCSSYNFNYTYQEKLYSWLDKRTPAEKGWIRGLCICVWTASSGLTLATRIASVFEVFLVGTRFLMYSAIKKDMSLTKTAVHEIFVHTPKNILRLVYTPIMFVLSSISIFVEPKYFTMHFLANTRISLKHIRDKTLGSESHKKDLACLNFNQEFFDYQKRFSELHNRHTSDFL